MNFNSEKSKSLVFVQTDMKDDGAGCIIAENLILVTAALAMLIKPYISSRISPIIKICYRVSELSVESAYVEKVALLIKFEQYYSRPFFVPFPFALHNLGLLKVSFFIHGVVHILGVQISSVRLQNLDCLKKREIFSRWNSKIA